MPFFNVRVRSYADYVAIEAETKEEAMKQAEEWFTGRFQSIFTSRPYNSEEEATEAYDFDF